jgi:hypothetical protein
MVLRRRVQRLSQVQISTLSFIGATESVLFPSHNALSPAFYASFRKPSGGASHLYPVA